VAALSKDRASRLLDGVEAVSKLLEMRLQLG
jgi:hypothetical protein